MLIRNIIWHHSNFISLHTFKIYLRKRVGSLRSLMVVLRIRDLKNMSDKIICLSPTNQVSKSNDIPERFRFSAQPASCCDQRDDCWPGPASELESNQILTMNSNTPHDPVDDTQSLSSNLLQAIYRKLEPTVKQSTELYDEDGLMSNARCHPNSILHAPLEYDLEATELNSKLHMENLAHIWIFLV